MSKTTAKHIFLYGIIGGILIAALKWSEYRFLVIDHSIEIYSGLIAATFAAVGIWLGLKLTRKQERIVVKESLLRCRCLWPSHFAPMKRKGKNWRFRGGKWKSWS